MKKIKGVAITLIAITAILAGIFILPRAFKNEAKADKPAQGQFLTSNSTTTSSSKEKTETKVEASTAVLGEFHEEDKKFEKLSNKHENVILKESDVNDGFELFNVAELDNDEGRISADYKGKNAINANTAKAATSQMLWNARHNEVGLEDLLRLYGFKVPENLVETKNGKRYLSGNGKQAYYAVENFLTSLVDVQTGQYDILRNATTTGMQNGKLVQDNQPKDWSGYQMLQVTVKETGEVFYHNYYCANSMLPTPHADVEKVKLPEPSVKPVEKKEKTKKETPKKETPTTPTPTTPIAPSVVPKKVEESPTFNQGAGVQDGSANPQTVWVEPSETYIAPVAPTAPAQGNAQSQGAITAPSSSWTGAGSFTDSNGTTKVESNGAVTTPSTTLPALTGENVVVPEVENGFTSNVGVNDGYKDANSIPMDD